MGRFKIYVNFHFHYVLVQIEGFNGTWFIPSCFGVCHTANGEMKRQYTQMLHFWSTLYFLNIHRVAIVLLSHDIAETLLKLALNTNQSIYWLLVWLWYLIKTIEFKTLQWFNIDIYSTFKSVTRFNGKVIFASKFLSLVK